MTLSSSSESAANQPGGVNIRTVTIAYDDLTGGRAFAISIRAFGYYVSTTGPRTTSTRGLA